MLGNLFTFFAAIVISAAIIPLMIRLAPRLGMVDQPDPRKVHSQPIPRVGGVGIVIGTLIPILLWTPLDTSLHAYLFGSMVLLVFGIWDDSRELGHYVKFVGQFIAVLAVVYYGDVYIATLPFTNLEAMPESFARPFTVFALVGMINAINHSDGLDGLAGGLSILSLSCIAYLANMAGGGVLVTMAFATIGGVLGFLRYNSHPARVFMGDGGSQFLGFTLGYMAVELTSKVNPALSPALPALILGLPIVDILAVFAQRAYGGMNWFRATRNHIHHRLLELGFDHYEAVVIIYSIQTFFVVSAVLLRYEADWLILSLYLGLCTLVFILIYSARHAGWRAHQPHAVSRLSWLIGLAKKQKVFMAAPGRLVGVAIPVLLIAVSLLADRVSRDLGTGAAVLLMPMMFYLVSRTPRDSILIRMISYVTSAFVVYLETRHLGTQYPAMESIAPVYYGALAIATGLAVRFANDGEFKTSPMDFLVIFFVLSVGILTRIQPSQIELGSMAVKVVILFYGCEVVISRLKNRWSPLSLATLGTLAVIGIRGLL